MRLHVPDMARLKLSADAALVRIGGLPEGTLVNLQTCNSTLRAPGHRARHAACGSCSLCVWGTGVRPLFCV